MSAVFRSMGKNYRNGVLKESQLFEVFILIPVDIQGLFSSLRSFLANSLSLIYDCRINYEVLLLVFFSLKSIVYIFAQKKYVFGRPRKCFRFPSVISGCLYSEVHGFFWRVGRFCDLISIDGHGERWRRASVDHRWSIGGNALGHRWDPVESQYGLCETSLWKRRGA